MTNSVDWNSLKKAADDATKPAPPGTYLCEVTKAEAGNASNSGNPMIKTTMRIVDGPAAGKTIFNNFNLTLDNAFAMSIFFRHMAAFGLDDSFFGAGPAVEQVAATLVERRARVTISIRQWQGQDRNQVDNVEPPLGGVVGPAVNAPTVGPTFGPGTTVNSVVPNTTPSTPGAPVTSSTTTPSVPGPPPAF